MKRKVKSPGSDGHSPTPHRPKKDTKRWCKGVPGREHEWRFEEWKMSRTYAGFSRGAVMSVEACAKCRRQKSIVGLLSCGKLGPGF